MHSQFQNSIFNLVLMLGIEKLSIIIYHIIFRIINVMLLIFAIAVSFSNSQLTSVAVLAMLHGFFHFLNLAILLRYKDEITMSIISNLNINKIDYEPNVTKTTHISNSTEEA